MSQCFPSSPHRPWCLVGTRAFRSPKARLGLRHRVLDHADDHCEYRASTPPREPAMVFPAGPKSTFSMLAAAAFPPMAPAMSWMIRLIMVLDMFPPSVPAIHLVRRLSDSAWRYPARTSRGVVKCRGLKAGCQIELSMGAKCRRAALPVTPRKRMEISAPRSRCKTVRLRRYRAGAAC